MKIQLNTDSHIKGDQALEERVNAMLEQQLGRFFERLTRIEVHLADLNAGKSGPDDKHCALEARIENADPIGVSHDDVNVEQAIRGACNKLKTRLDTHFDRLRSH